MLQSVSINGFKTLQDFSLDLRLGINALIGANGSGKTNILQGLEFVSHIVRSNLNDIPMKMGCEPAQLFDLNADEKIIDIKFVGSDLTFCRDLTSDGTVDENLTKFIPLRTDYLVKNVILYEHGDNLPLTFLSQFVKLDFLVCLNGEIISNNLVLEYSKGQFKVADCDMAGIAKYVYKDAENVVDKISTSSASLSHKPIILGLSEELYPVFNLLQGLNFNKAIDIYPTGIRNEGKQRELPIIRYDGCGLPSTLLNLSENHPEKFKLIEENIKSISSDFVGLQVTYDETTNKINVTTKQVADQSGNLREIPLNLLADGMLKWYSLIAGLEFSNKNIVIDEPENFLDNRMQHELSDYIRQELEETDLICLMATHSVTLLNSLSPDEIVFVSLNNGMTRASRVADSERLEECMRKTGDRLGQLYETGVLEIFLDENSD